MDGLYYALNPGAFFRKIFPKQMRSQVKILIWAAIFIINIVLVYLAQNMLIYTYSDFTVEGMAEERYFENCEILSVNQLENNYRMPGDYYVEYVDNEGNSRIVCLEAFPDSMFKRAKLVKDSDMMVINGMVQYEKGGETTSLHWHEYVKEAMPKGMFDVLWQQPNHNKLLVGIYVGLGACLLLIEFLIYGIFHRLFRE